MATKYEAALRQNNKCDPAISEDMIKKEDI
jgi:hypothetical protein